MKFSITLTLALLSAAVSAIAVPADTSAELAARDVDLDVEKSEPSALPDTLFEGEDLEIADILDEDDDDLTDEDFDLIVALENAENGGNALAVRSLDSDLEARDIEARGIKSWILKKLFKKITKSKLGKKVWKKLPAAKRKKITKYVKKAKKEGKKGSKTTKKWLTKEVKPVVLSVIGAAIGTSLAKVIVNDVVPFVVDVILFVIF